MGKARVTPLKPVTIPRLELTAATVAVIKKINQIIHEELEFDIQETFYWTDSTLVLQYINNKARRFKTFIANRIAVIHDNSRPSQWRWVESSSNSADHASRGIRPSDADKVNQWLNGPSFLWQEKEYWPKCPIGLQTKESDLELRKEVQVHEIQASTSQDPLDVFFKRYSTWYRLQKSVAWLLRFLCYLHCRCARSQRPSAAGQDETDSLKISTGPLTVQEINVATKKLIMFIQRQAFLK